MTATADPHRRFVQILRRTVAAPESDAALLARFVESRDETAFAAIVERHGSLVLGVCRRMLGDSADAEDAFQAVFLALVRSGRRIRKGESLASWLYGAAYRVCQKARRGRSRIRTLERKATRGHSADPLAEISLREFLATLDDELARLPESLRLPLVLCLVEGLSQNEAAARLGCSPGSIKGRLERGREKLRRRLLARGVTLAAALSAAAVGSTNAAVPPELFARAATIAAGTAVPEAIAKLAGAAMHSSASLARISAAILLAAAISIAAMGGSKQPEPKLAAEKPDKPAKATARVDRFGDPLPEGALMRLGTVQFRVPGIAGVGFRPSGELVAVDEQLNLHVWSVDGKSKSVVTNLAKRKFGFPEVVISPDARFVGAFSGDQKVVVWDISGETAVKHLIQDVNDFHRCCFSPDGRWMAIDDHRPGRKRVISLCDLDQKSWVDLPTRGASVSAMSFSADGKKLAVTDGMIATVFDTATRKESCSVGLPRMSVESLAISPDGKTLAIQPSCFVHDPVPKVRFVSVQTGDEATWMKSPPDKVGSWISFSPDGKTVFQGIQQGIREWNPVTGKTVQEIVGPGQSSVVFSRDGRRLASRSDAAVLLWDNANRRPVRADLENAGHTNGVSGIAISPNGELIATIAWRGEIRVWSAETGRFLYAVRSSLSGEEAIAFLPDSKSFVALANDYVTPVVFDASTGKELRRFKVPPEMSKTKMIHELRLSDDGTTLITTVDPVSTNDNSYRVHWDVGTGKLSQHFERVAGPDTRQDQAAAHSPDDRWLAADGKLTCAKTKESIQLVPLREWSCAPARFSRDSRLVAMTRAPTIKQQIDWDRSTAIVFDLNSMSKVAEFRVGNTFGYGSSFSRDGRHLAGSGPGHVTIWDLATCRPVRRFTAPARTHAIAIMPDGRRLITGHYDCTAIVWDLARLRDNQPAALSSDELTKLWNTLGGDDAAKAFAATFELCDHPKPTIEFLRKQLKPAHAANAELVQKLAASLDAKSFAEREKSEKELRALGDSAIPKLRATLKDNPSPEKKTRIERLLAEAAKFVLPPGERLQQVRAIAVLEHIGTDEAPRLLKELAGGLPEARLTREAAEALTRLQLKSH